MTRAKADVHRDLLGEVMQCFKDGMAAEKENYRLSAEDMRFVDDDGPQAQWDANALTKRAGRPCYTFDRVSSAVDQVKGDQRQNQPGIIVSPTNVSSSKQKAEIFEGMIRNIESQSQAQIAYDNAFDCAVKGGVGYWRIVPVYCDDESFDQEARIEWIENPFTILFDPGARDWLKRDARWCLETERMSKDAYEAQWPDSDVKSLDFTTQYDRDWYSTTDIRIATYWKRITKNKKIVQLSNGLVRDYTDIKAIEDELAQAPGEPVTIKAERTVKASIIRWWKLSAAGILEGPIDYKWKYIPVVPVYGRTANLEGKRKNRGLVRKAKDAQRVFNYVSSTTVEAYALTPRSPIFATPAMIKGYEDQYNNANVQNHPYLLYNIDPKSPTARPERAEPAQVSPAAVNILLQAADNVRATTGYFQSSLGQPDNAQAGVAIDARKTEGDVGSYEFTSNLAKSMQYSGEILIDMIPKIYDGARIVRIMGLDGKKDFAPINMSREQAQQLMPRTPPNPQVMQGDPREILNDLSEGTYDVAVKIGPAYTTLRERSQESLVEFAGMQGSPVLQVGADLIAKNMDTPVSRELERRLRIPLIQQGLVQPENQEETAFLPQPQQPDPLTEALIGKTQAQTIEAHAKAEKATHEAMQHAQTVQGHPLDLEKKIDEIIGQRLENMLKARELHLSGVPTLSKTNGA